MVVVVVVLVALPPAAPEPVLVPVPVPVCAKAAPVIIKAAAKVESEILLIAFSLFTRSHMESEPSAGRACSREPVRSARIQGNGGPTRTRTWNQTVMSGRL